MKTWTIKGGPAPSGVKILDSEGVDVTNQILGVRINMHRDALATADLSVFVQVDVQAEVAEHDLPPYYLGRVGVCSKGRPGLITGRKKLEWGLSWVGIGLDDGTPWASREPKIVAESVAEWFKLPVPDATGG